MAKAAFLFPLLLGLSAAGAAQTPNPPAAIVAAAADCWQATGRSAVDVASLGAKGWKSSEFKSKDGKALDTPLRFYSKADSSVMLMVLPGGDKPACSVVSRVTGLDAYRPLMAELQTRLKSIEPSLKAARSGDNGAAFFGGGRIGLIEPTGTSEQPSVRFSVGINTPAKGGR